MPNKWKTQKCLNPDEQNACCSKTVRACSWLPRCVAFFATLETFTTSMAWISGTVFNLAYKSAAVLSDTCIWHLLAITEDIYTFSRQNKGVYIFWLSKFQKGWDFRYIKKNKETKVWISLALIKGLAQTELTLIQSVDNENLSLKEFTIRTEFKGIAHFSGK